MSLVLCASCDRHRRAADALCRNPWTLRPNFPLAFIPGKNLARATSRARQGSCTQRTPASKENDPHERSPLDYDRGRGGCLGRGPGPPGLAGKSPLNPLRSQGTPTHVICGEIAMDAGQTSSSFRDRPAKLRERGPWALRRALAGVRGRGWSADSVRGPHPYGERNTGGSIPSRTGSHSGSQRPSHACLISPVRKKVQVCSWALGFLRGKPWVSVSGAAGRLVLARLGIP